MCILNYTALSEDAELQSELKQVKNQLRGELYGYGCWTMTYPFTCCVELKDENVSLKEENKSLREYIDKLLLIVMENAPGALAAK